jgi:adenine phosphoribosyltransferase
MSVEAQRPAWRHNPGRTGMRYEGQESYEIAVAGLRRRLPVVPINESLWIAAFVLWGDVELTNACARLLADRLRPMSFDCLVSVEAKALPLAHMVATYLSDERAGRYFPYAVCRKSVKGYMRDPLTVQVKSITTAAAQTLVLDGTDARRVRGKRVAVVDDVVSTGGSLRAVNELLERVNSEVVARAAVLLEEGGYQDPALIHLGTLPIFTK